MLVAAGRIGVPEDIDGGLVEFLQHERHRIQRREESRLHRILIGCKGDVGRHVQDDLVAGAGDADTGSLKLSAQFGFLPVHVVADGTAGQRTDTGANQRIAAVIATGEQAEAGAG